MAKTLKNIRTKSQTKALTTASAGNTKVVLQCKLQQVMLSSDIRGKEMKILIKTNFFHKPTQNLQHPSVVHLYVRVSRQLLVIPARSEQYSGC